MLSVIVPMLEEESVIAATLNAILTIPAIAAPGLAPILPVGWFAGIAREPAHPV